MNVLRLSKRVAKGKYGILLQTDFVDIVQALAKDQPLAQRYQDHPLTGQWSDHRDCHIAPDLVLIYKN